MPHSLTHGQQAGPPDEPVSKQHALYEQVTRALRKTIEDGGWTPGLKLPSERDLSERYGCARMTVRRALQELESEGLVVRSHGSGTYVADLQPISNLLNIRDIRQEIAERGHRHQSELLSRRIVRADVTTAAAMGVQARSRVFRCELIHYENDTPIQFEERFVNPELVPDFMSMSLLERTPSSYLFAHAPLTAAEQLVEAVNADAALARYLRVPVGAALLRISRRTMSKGRVASLARLFHPGHCYQLVGAFSVSSKG